MPDLIWHPERTEITGFRLPDQVEDKLRRNDYKSEFLTFYEAVKNCGRNVIMGNKLYNIYYINYKKQ